MSRTRRGSMSSSRRRRRRFIADPNHREQWTPTRRRARNVCSGYESTTVFSHVSADALNWGQVRDGWVGRVESGTEEPWEEFRVLLVYSRRFALARLPLFLVSEEGAERLHYPPPFLRCVTYPTPTGYLGASRVRIQPLHWLADLRPRRNSVCPSHTTLELVHWSRNRMGGLFDLAGLGPWIG